MVQNREEVIDSRSKSYLVLVQSVVQIIDWCSIHKGGKCPSSDLSDRSVRWLPEDLPLSRTSSVIWSRVLSIVEVGLFVISLKALDGFVCQMVLFLSRVLWRIFSRRSPFLSASNLFTSIISSRTTVSVPDHSSLQNQKLRATLSSWGNRVFTHKNSSDSKTPSDFFLTLWSMTKSALNRGRTLDCPCITLLVWWDFARIGVTQFVLADSRIALVGLRPSVRALSTPSLKADSIPWLITSRPLMTSEVRNFLETEGNPSVDIVSVVFDPPSGVVGSK